MIYVMSDLHGCYEQYLKALELIKFSENDILYVLGDVIDRGSGSIEILQHMMMQPNIIPLMGNHEVMAMSLLPKLCTEITEENYNSTLTVDDMISLEYWMHDGGTTTINQFQKLSRFEQEMILDYLDEFLLFETVCFHGRNYFLSHAGITDANLIFDELRPEHCIFQSNETTLDGYTILCGHTPTSSQKIEFLNGQIRLDCGCVFGGNLAVYCLDTQESTYISSLS